MSLAAALTLCGAAAVQAVQARNPFNSIVRILTTSTAPMPAQTEGDLLQFVDGSAMHGELHGMDACRGLRWRHRDAKYPIDLQPSHLDFIRFVHASSMTLRRPPATSVSPMAMICSARWFLWTPTTCNSTPGLAAP